MLLKLCLHTISIHLVYTSGYHLVSLLWEINSNNCYFSVAFGKDGIPVCDIRLQAILA